MKKIHRRHAHQNAMCAAAEEVDCDWRNSILGQSLVSNPVQSQSANSKISFSYPNTPFKQTFSGMLSVIFVSHGKTNT